MLLNTCYIFSEKVIIMNGLIIIGYQGIGKTTLAKSNDEMYLGNGLPVIDFESSLFKIDGDRVDDWYVIYCRQAVAMAKQGFVVFVSSHQCVRNELGKYDQDDFGIATIAPTYALKEQWIDKLHKRYFNDPSEKNLAAFKDAEANYDKNIYQISSNPQFTHIFINSMGYSLKTILKGLFLIFDLTF